MGLLGTLPVQGDFKVLIEPAVYPADAGGAALELSYEIPFTSLTFVRESSGFEARYRVSVEVVDRRGSTVAGEMWERVVSSRTYERTMARDSVETGVVRLGFAGPGTQARVEFRSLSSERRGRAYFKVAVPRGGILLQLLKSGQPHPSRKYGANDTIAAVAELLGAGQAGEESCRFRVLGSGRVVTGATAALFDSLGRKAARFRYAIADSTGVARLGGSEYELEASVGSGAGRLGARVPFRVDVPFFLSDEAWTDKVDRLLHVASQEEMARLRVTPRAEREQAWRDFWKPKDRIPTTERNEREEEYFERIAYCEEHYSHGDRGYRSDRARVYVRYGAPDQVESRPFEIDAPAYETWYYYRPNRRFLFVDRFGAGELRLQNMEALDDY
jgi:GWxTD domain-containing protein